MQPFHIHENPNGLELLGLDDCHSTGEVVELVRRTWPYAEIYEGGHHVQVSGKHRMVIHETWDPQTCLGSEPPDPNAKDDRGWLARSLERIFA